MANFAHTVEVLVIISSIAEKSFPALVNALIEKRWSVQRGIASDTNSLYIRNSGWWTSSCFSEDIKVRNGVFSEKIEEALEEVELVIEEVKPKALDSHGVRIRGKVLPK